MEPEWPSLRYYRACVGSWGATIAVTAAAGATPSAPVRVALRLLQALSARVGPPRMRTTVRFIGDLEVEHTTEVRWLGLRLQRSVEIFTLRPDGRSVTVRGEMTGHATVDEAGEGADYVLRWRGTTVRQSTRRVGDTVEVRQLLGAGCVAVEVLVRTPVAR